MNDLSGGVQIIAEVHPQVLFCRNAAVVRITRGLGKVQEGCFAGDWRSLTLDGQPLYVSHIEHSGSYKDIIRLGYGGGCAVPDAAQVNAPFTNLKNAVGAISPLLNLLTRGAYLVADMDLMPVQQSGDRLDCFWNVPNSSKSYWPCPEFSTWAGPGYAVNRHPLYPVPTQRAADMDPSRVQAYMQQLSTAPAQIPRAIGLYLRGSAVLLLDGHHKALAAAATGEPVKTMVIFRLTDEKSILAAAAQGKRLFLRGAQTMLRICDNKETVTSGMAWFGEEKSAHPSPQEAPAEPDAAQWGQIDPQWIKPMNNPHLMNKWTLREGLEFPVHGVRELIVSLQAMPLDELHKHQSDVNHLRAYVRLAPGSKWITAAQLQWLADIEEKYYI